jgi:nucleoid-associated protein YgaU
VTLQKLTIAYGEPGRFEAGSVVAMFNPTEIRIARSVGWRRRKVIAETGGWARTFASQQFGSIEPARLELTLFFDTYELGEDVRTRTAQVAVLAAIDKERHQPPICKLSWGTMAELFVGVLTRIDQRFTLFLPGGDPVRAELSCSFVEYQTLAEQRRSETSSSDVVKTRVVRRSDTLQSLAAEEYGDPALWRLIARANPHVGNPRRLTPGTRLTLPRWHG